MVQPENADTDRRRRRRGEGGGGRARQCGRGTAAHLREHGLPVADVVAKIGEDGTDAVELIRSGAVQLVVNSPRGRGPRADGEHIRAAASTEGIPLLTTASAALAAARGLADWRRYPLEVRTLQAYHRGIVRDPEPEAEAPV